MTRRNTRSAMALFGAAALTIAAGSANGQVDADKGIVVLNPDADAAFFVGGSVEVNVPFIHVNSSSNIAVETNGNRNSIITTTMSVVGNADLGGSTFVGDLVEGAGEFVNPYAGLPIAPANESADKGHYLSDEEGYHFVSPGYYSGGITTGSSSMLVFLPGVYVLDGVGLEVLGQSSLIADSAVFVIRGTGTVYVAGGASVIATPPSAGAYRGVSIFQEPGNANTIEIAGGGDISIGGAIYAPSGKVTITGTGAVATTFAAVGDFVIADRVEVSGRGSIAIGDAEFAVVSVFGQASWD